VPETQVRVDGKVNISFSIDDKEYSLWFDDKGIHIWCDQGVDVKLSDIFNGRWLLIK